MAKIKIEESELRLLVQNVIKESVNKWSQGASSKSAIKEESELAEYVALVKHDNGYVKLTLVARSEDDAKQRIMRAEGCPESAIKSVKPKKAKNKPMVEESFGDEEDEFIPQGSYTLGNAGGYEIMISDSGDMAKVRDAFGSDNPVTSDWLPIEYVDVEDGEVDDEGYPETEPVIDPEGYNIPLNQVMRMHQFESKKSNNFRKLVENAVRSALKESINEAKSKKKAKFGKVMSEFGKGTLKTSAGDVVTDRKQAVAIAYSESGLDKKKQRNESVEKENSFAIEKPNGKVVKYASSYGEAKNWVDRHDPDGMYDLNIRSVNDGIK